MRQAAEQAADAIRESILVGRIPAGARIAERTWPVSFR